MIKVAVSQDTLSPRLRRVLNQVTVPAGLPAVLGRAGANALRRHFRDRNKTPNKLGGKRTNFWSRVAESVQSPRIAGGGTTISVDISHPHIGAKLARHTVVPRKRKWLPIPIAPEGHGRSPRTLNLTLTMRRGASGLTLLLGRAGANGAFKAIYVLKKSVTIDKDPRALPDDSVVASDLERAGAIFLQRESQRQ